MLTCVIQRFYNDYFNDCSLKSKDLVMNDSPHILVVDDHQDIRHLVKRHLQQHGYRVTLAADAKVARRIIADNKISLVVLDIMMPGEDGLSLCRHLRETSNLPVILLTALSEETDRVIGLEMGADDYLCKPFGPRELIARIKTVLRRVNSVAPFDELASAKLTFERWTLDTDLRELTDDKNVIVPLSSAEYALLIAFISRPKRVLNRDQLLDLCQGREAKALDRSIDNQVSRLRQKIEIDPKNPLLISTVWGEGYRFSTDVKQL